MEDVKDSGDLLGTVRKPLKFDDTRSINHIYGKPSATKRKNGKPLLTASELIKGYYRFDETEPDIDLGTSITPGFRNIPTDTVSWGMILVTVH